MEQIQLSSWLYFERDKKPFLDFNLCIALRNHLTIKRSGTMSGELEYRCISVRQPLELLVP